METWTVIGGWDGDEPIPVGVIEGKHEVHGGDSSAFESGLWATSVEADNYDQAEVNAVAEMRDTLTS